MAKPHEYDGQKWQMVSSDNTGMPVYVTIQNYGFFNQIKKKSKNNYNCLYFINHLNSLNNRHGMVKSYVSKFKTSQYCLPLEGGEIKYTIDNGKLYITNIDMSFKKQGNKQRPAGLFDVSKLADGLKIDTKELEKTNKINIAINGAFDDDSNLVKTLPKFIERGYKPVTTAVELETKGYNLFYNPCGYGLKSDMRQVFDSSGTGTEAAMKLTALIEAEAKKGTELNWTVHEKGHALFKRALQNLTNSGRCKGAVQRNLAKHRVFYANPTMNLSLVDHYRKKAGMKLAPNHTLINNASIEQTWANFNFISETHISLRQISEQGQSDAFGRTSGHIASNILTRTAVATVGSYAVPKAITLGAAGWAASLIGIAVSNRPKSNHKVIENTADIMNDAFNFGK